MGRTRVKICGITRVDDALAAAELGADAVGLVRHLSSRRNVGDDASCDIIEALPAFVQPVLLFVNEFPQTIVQTARSFGAGLVQLHGDEQASDVTEAVPLRVIKALRVDAASIRFGLTQWRRIRPPNLAGIVLESAGQPGGSGVENDWDLLRRLRDEGYLAGDQPPVIFAGGLTPQNVGAIVREFRPFAVDVSSGVEEAAPGIKSRHKIAEFIAAVTEASA